MPLIKSRFVKQICEIRERQDTYMIFYVLKGKARLQVIDEEYLMEKSDVIVVNPWEQYNIKENNILLSIFEINAGVLYKLVNYSQMCIQCNTLKEKNENFLKLKKILDTLINTFFEGNNNNKLFFNKASYDLVAFLITEFSNNNFLNQVENTRKHSIENYIHAQYQEDISLEQISDHFNLSPQYFSKHFKELFGITFSKYLNSVRVKNACYDLLHSETTILKIALENGFPNVSSFISCFNEKYNMSPTKYKENYKNKNLSFSNVGYDLIKPYLQQNNLELDEKSHIVHIKLVNNTIQLDRYWSNLCNLGELSKISNREMKHQIHELQKELGFEYARVTLDTLKSEFDKDTQYINEQSALDILIDEGFKILLCINYRDFRNIQYLEYFERLLYHFVNRYGFKYIASWKFELFYDSDFIGKKAQEYHRLYEALKTLLEKIGINSEIYGPGLLLDKEGKNLIRFLNKAKSLQNLSLSVAPYSLQVADDRVFIDRSTDPNYILNQYELAKKIITDYPKIREIHISSWKDSLNDINIVNDSCYRAASIVKNVIQAYGVLNTLPIDKPLDMMLEETNRRKGIFSGLPGLLTTEGIRKPSFYAYKFLKNLDKNFSYKDAHVLVTNDNLQYFQIICHNYKKLNYNYYTYENDNSENPDINEFYENDEVKLISFKLEGVLDGEYILKERTINEERGSVVDTWKEMNFESPSFFGPDELDYLKSTAKPFIKAHKLIVKNGVLKFECTLQPNEIKHLHLIYVH